MKLFLNWQMDVVLLAFLAAVTMTLLMALFRFAVFSTLHSELKRIFPLNLKLKPCYMTFSIKSICGESKFGSIQLGRCSLFMNARALFGHTQKPLISMKISRLDVVIRRVDDRKQTTKVSMSKWLFKKGLNYFVAVFVKSISIEVEDFRMSIQKRQLELKSMKMILLRDSDGVSMNTKMKGVSYTNGVPLLYINELGMAIKATSEAIESFIDYGPIINSLNLSVPKLQFSYRKRKVNVDDVEVSLGRISEEDNQVEMLINSFIVDIPKFDLHTEVMNVLVSDIGYEKGRLSSGKIVAERNGQQMLQILSTTTNGYELELGSFEMELPTPFIIDIGLIMRYINKLNDNGWILRLTSLRVIAPTAKIIWALSDHHKLMFTLVQTTIQNLIIRSKEFSIDAYFKSNTFRFMEAFNGQLSYGRPNLCLKCKRSEIVLSCEFAERNYIVELLHVFGWLGRQYRGLSNDEAGPPTKRIFSFICHRARLIIERPHLTDVTEKSVEAKKLAMVALKLRQEMAINALSAKGITHFNNKELEEEFEKASKRILFEQYRQIYEAMPADKEGEFCKIDAVDWEWTIDGPSIHSRQNAIDKISSIEPNVQQEKIGRIFGGLWTVSASLFDISTMRTGSILKFENFTLNGHFFNAKKLGETRRDFYHFKITCDNGQQTFLIPGIAAKSVVFLEINGKCSNIEMSVSPVLTELKQDIKLVTAMFRRKKMKYKRLRIFDTLRLRCRCKAILECENMIVDIRDTISPFSDHPQGKIYVPSVGLNFDGNDVVVISDSVSARIFSGGEFKEFIRFPKPLITMRLVTKNPINESGTHPVFIPIDTTKLGEPGYDPFELYRTHTFSCKIVASFPEQTRMLFTLDDMQVLIDRYMIPTPNNQKFNIPCDFIAKPFPYPTFEFIDLAITLPKIAFVFQQSKISGTVMGDPITIRLNTGENKMASLKSDSLIVKIVQHEEHLLSSTINDLSIEERNGVINVAVDSVDCNLSSELIASRHDFYFKFPLIRRPVEIPEFTTLENFVSHFSNHRMAISVKQFTATANLIRSRRKVLVKFCNFAYDQMLDAHKVPIHLSHWDEFQLFAVENVPMFVFQNCDFRVTTVDTYHVRVMHADSLLLNLRPDDVDVFIPELASYKYSDHLPKREQCPHTTHVRIDLDIIQCYIMNMESMILVSGTTRFPFVEITRNQDGSGKFESRLMSLNITDEQATDVFHNVMESANSPDSRFLDISFEKAPNIMKCPVYKKIEIEISSFISHIHLKFIKTLINVFPTAEDLKLLNLEDDNDDIVFELESMQKEKLENPETSMFCQEFVLKPFYAELNLRLKEKGAFKEFTRIPFRYKGLKMVDMFGSKQTMKAFMRRHVKKTLIKSLPSMFLGSRRHLTTEVPDEPV